MKSAFTSILVFAVLISSPLQGQSSIVGSKHDFSQYAWSGGELCLPCHTPMPRTYGFPRREQPKVIWSRDLSRASFTMYANLKVSRMATGQPGESSKLCLSCHDGTTAVDSYGGSSGSRYVRGSANIGTDLRDDHPIGLVYPSGAAGYNHPATFPAGGVRLLRSEGISNRVECSSCHDPHGAGYESFLRAPMTGSALCLQCHNV